MLGNAHSPPLLLLVDLQRGIDDPSKGPRNNPDAEATIQRLLSTWRERGFPVVHVRHDSPESNSPLRAGLPGFEYKPGLEPYGGEQAFIKQVNGPFTGTELGAWIDEHGLDTIVIGGLVTDDCVSTTAPEAENRGYEVYVVEDGTATFGRKLGDRQFDCETVHQTALAQLSGEFAAIIKAEALLDEVQSSDGSN